MDKTIEATYGIWIYRKGWLKGNGDVIAFGDFDFAQEVASHIKNASARRIDKSYQDIEKVYLEEESRTLWHTFKSLFKRKSNT